jgi:Tfp pilus assembly protein PilF
MRIVPVRLFRGLVAVVFSALVSACSGLSVGEGLNPSTARMEGEKPSEQVRVYLRVAQEALDTRDYTTAIRFYGTILDRTPGNLAAAKGIATAYARDGRTGQAVKAYETAIALAPDDRLVRENLAALLNSRIMSAAGKPQPRKVQLSMDLSPSGTFENTAAQKLPSAVPEALGAQTDARPAIAHTTIEAAQTALQSVAEAAIIEELGEIVPAAGNPFLLFYPPTPENLPIRSVSASARPVTAMSSPAPATPAPSPNAEIDRKLRAFIRTPPGKAPAKQVEGHYRVQLAAYRTARHADRGVAIFQGILGDAGPKLEILERQKPNADAQAINFRIRTAALGSRQIADRLCNALRAGGQECLVIRHKAIIWKTTA